MNKKNKQKTVKRTTIGGQAVIEGVMMRGKSSMAIAVRDGDGVIRLESERLVPLEKKPLFYRMPIVRGVISFFSSLVSGTRTLTRSAAVFGESEPSDFEKWLSKKFKLDVMNVVIALSVIIGILLSVGLFVFLPQLIYEALFVGVFGISNLWVQTITEGLLRIAVFISYILLTSLLKDIRRTYQYHGAEHKTISCYEAGKELTVENVRGCTRVHDRCGTTFMFLVMVVSILVVALMRNALEPVFPTLGVKGFSLNKLWQFLIRLACIPLTAGLSYELLKALSKTTNPLVYPLKLPGLLLQRLTTKEPDDGMMEVAIASFNQVLLMDADESIPAQKFITAQKYAEYRKEKSAALINAGVTEDAELDWIFCHVLQVKRDDLAAFPPEKYLSAGQVEKIDKIVAERTEGRPLDYILGEKDFYGFPIKVNENVLIPRPETELLAERVIAETKAENTVLDLCTGSGAIAITVKKKTGAVVTASDISDKALEIARENAVKNDAEIRFVESDLFNEIPEKFDRIVSNPPYIKRAELDNLQAEVKKEPRLALDGGEDGLDFYREIAKAAPAHLTDNGILLLEIGEGQAADVKNLLAERFEVEIFSDYSGIERIVKAVLRK